jgi:hypothetical protein
LPSKLTVLPAFPTLAEISSRVLLPDLFGGISGAAIIGVNFPDMPGNGTKQQTP